jgi:predicted amidohydrolase YtcJ
MLIQRGALIDGSVVDVRVGAQIMAVAGRLVPAPGEDVYDAAGGMVIPGLHDHHVHLRSAAAALASVRVGPPQVRSREDVAGALAGADVDSDSWIRAVGYHDCVAGALDRTALDALSPAVPVRVQHRSGAMWTVNSAGLARLGMSDHPDGRLWRTDTDATPAWAHQAPSLRPVSAQLSAWGVTGVTDATPGQTTADIDALAAARRTGELRQRLHCMAPADIPEMPGVTIGPAKVILDDDGLDLDELEGWIRGCHGQGRAVAVHCVTDSQLVVTIAALRSAGTHPLDRVEHAAVVPQACMGELAGLGVTVVTQPNFIAERGDQYLAEVPAAEHHQLWRVGSLLRHGVAVSLSTDMPFGDGDPWAAMRAAVHRSTVAGAVLGADERVSAQTALAMFLGHPDRPAQPRSVSPGAAGDLCVLAVPPVEALHTLDSGMVAVTILAGDVVEPVNAAAP